MRRVHAYAQEGCQFCTPPAGSSFDARIKAVIARGDSRQIKNLLNNLRATGDINPSRQALLEGAFTRSLTREVAKKLGFNTRIAPQRAPFNSHGQSVFSNGKNFITRDVDSHVGGFWKMFNRRGDRLGTFDKNLSRIGD